jgi:mannose-6-phosphate isomerase
VPPQPAWRRLGHNYSRFAFAINVSPPPGVKTRKIMCSFLILISVFNVVPVVKQKSSRFSLEGESKLICDILNRRNLEGFKKYSKQREENKLNTFIPKPYKLYNKIQNYDWGTKNDKAVIPALLNIQPEKDVPYAELWIGAHPKTPSEIEIDGSRIKLYEAINKYPQEILGSYVVNKFGKNFPFLLKILSAARALSIQTHPNKEQAVKLHAADPQNYPDDNHKPEIAIALDSLTAVAGFRPAGEIEKNLEKYPEMFSFAETGFREKLQSADQEDKKDLIKHLYACIMKEAGNEELLKKVIDSVLSKLSLAKVLNTEEFQFKKQFELYKYDVGLLSFFFFNIIELKPMQAIFTGAGIPHAYIEGNIIECMANSDNVVRAGLTNKFKDVSTLLEIMEYGFSKFNIINEMQAYDEITFKTTAEEFEITACTKDKGDKKAIASNGKSCVILLTKGEVKVTWNAQSEVYKKGGSFLLPASLDKIDIACTEKTQFCLVQIP